MGNDTQGLHKVLQRFSGNTSFQTQHNDSGFVEEMALKVFEGWDFSGQICCCFKSVGIAHMVLGRWESDRHAQIVQPC